MDLSIIIVSFNTVKVTSRCLKSLRSNFSKYRGVSYEVIVVDNGSVDGSVAMLREESKKWPNLMVVVSKKNVGYGKGNNMGVAKSKGNYILYLNSDAIVSDIDFADLMHIFKHDPKVGALTVKVMLTNGLIDPASHRGIPTPWASLSYFLGLEKMLGRVPLIGRIFGKYHMTYMNLNSVHEIEVPTGAFLMVRSEIIKKIGGFDRDYFAYGEDVEMAYRIAQEGYKILYYPLWEVLHLKSVSGLKKPDPKVRAFIRFHFYDSMKIFYRKHYEKKYPWIFNQIIYLAIDLKSRLSS